MISIIASIVSRDLGIGEALINSLLGMLVVFFMLFLLFIVLKIMPALFKKAKNGDAAPVATPAPVTPAAAPVVSTAGKVPASGSLGEIALHGVPEKTAAMAMAIVANELETPLNELRFISVKQID